MSAPFDRIPSSATVFGRYEVRRVLGSSDFSSVYLGHDTQLHRSVAIKVVHAGSAQLSTDEQALIETRKLARLNHSGIVTVHDVGLHDGHTYIVSEYLEGIDLGRWLRENRAAAWQDAARIIAAVADALAHAHDRLIVHGDVKPANIILTSDRAPVLVDFGLSLVEQQARRIARGIGGTPWYMSPEQAKGAVQRIDGHTDIYSLGLVLYELLTARVPFRAANFDELLRKICEDEPQPPRQLISDIPSDLERVCLKALSKPEFLTEYLVS